MSVVIVDSGGANINSVQQAFRRLGVTATLSSDAAEIRGASHVVLPGVGAAGDAMAQLRRLDLVQTLRDLQQPTLGICLGMQLLFARSQENESECLGLLPGEVRRFEQRNGRSVPHMGWNEVSQNAESLSALFQNIPDRSYFYFVHSYRAPDGAWVTGTSDYEESFPASVKLGNFMGVQFHPEKSADVGAQLLRNFLNL